ncbi:MAG TPA: hypothetical protein PLW65_15305 [Pseudomonadota bacterium]|nr:hypothetical protein [Pseudomonadota bacterium]
MDLGAPRPRDLTAERDLAAPPADLAAAPGPEECPLPPMTALSPGGLPPNPYGPLPMADACVRRRHDAIIILGCPNETSGARPRVDQGAARRGRGTRESTFSG